MINILQIKNTAGSPAVFFYEKSTEIPEFYE